MAINIAAIVASVIVQRMVSALIDNFSNHYQTGGAGNLDVFLKTLSNDFAVRVENIVRSAFSNENFAKMKVKVISSATSLRTYVATEGEDQFYLNQASADIVEARSILMVEVERVLSFLTKREDLAIACNYAKGKVVLSNLRAIESAMSCLQAIAAEDLTILAVRAQLYPNLKGEIIARIDEYVGQATVLKTAYVARQMFRTMTKRIFDTVQEFPEKDGLAVNFEVGFFDDGVAWDRRKIVGYCPPGLADLDKKKRDLEREMQNLCQAKNQKYVEAAKKRSTGVGNLDEAIEIWKQVKTHYQT